MIYVVKKGVKYDAHDTKNDKLWGWKSISKNYYTTFYTQLLYFIWLSIYLSTHAHAHSHTHSHTRTLTRKK